MCPALPLFALLLAVEPTEAVVGSGETLAQVARRTLGTEKAASELKALNALGGEQVPAGTKLKLPGQERTFAASTIKTARSMLSQAHVTEGQRKEAEHLLEQAEDLFASARYVEAARAADAAWTEVARSTPGPTRFSVEVNKDGRTRVKSVSGSPVRVEAQGGSEPVYAGQQVQVEVGKRPLPAELTEPPLPAPTLVSPQHRAQLTLKATGGDLGAVHLTWTPVAGAEHYDVVVEGNGRLTMTQALRPEATLQSLKEGTYKWSVRAVAGNRRSEPSAQRHFELLRNLKIEAKTTNWK